MKHEYPKWIYPDGDVARGFVVQDAEEHAAKTAPSAQANESESLVLPVLEAPPKNKGGRPRKST